ncbi:2-amino-3-ketobutyrate coenzyme A ligase [Streptomyces badius]
MFDSVRDDLRTTLDEIRAAGLHKPERVIGTPQSATVEVTSGGRPGEVLNFCANNYLGLADHPDVVAAAHEALDRWGYGMASVRFICGTQEVHKELEQRLSAFLGQEDTILYSSCFDANGGVFETLLGPEDAVISDALNHASIIDGIRLSKAKRHRYANRDRAVRLVAGLLQEAHPGRAHPLMVGREVLGVQEEADPAARLRPDGPGLRPVLRPGQQQPRAVRRPARAHHHPAGAVAPVGVLHQLEAERVAVEGERLVVVADDQGDQGDVGHGGGLPEVRPAVGLRGGDVIRNTIASVPGHRAECAAWTSWTLRAPAAGPR